MEKITRIKTPKRGELHTYFVVSDWHARFLHYPSYNILKKHAKMVPKEQRRLIILGDFFECTHLMKKPHEMKKMAKCVSTIEDYLIPESENEFEWGNGILDEQQKIFTHIYYVGGNHGIRYLNFMKYCSAAYAHNFDYRKQLHLKERGIPHVAYNDYLDIGNMALTHGMWHGASHNKKHMEGVQKSVMYGHVHHANSTSFFTRGMLKKVWSLPCMCDLNPDYIKNKDNNWSNGYATLNMKHNGNFNVHIHEIFDEELILPTGKRIKG